MVDVETIGQGPRAALASVGWCLFDVERAHAPGHAGKVNVLLSSSTNAGLEADGATVEWWLRQSEEARAALLDPEPVPLVEALRAVSSALSPAKYVWAKPPQFDLVILRSAYRALGKRPPWHPRQERCLRTLIDLAFQHGNPFDGLEVEGPRHCAMVDAVAQARVAQRAWWLVRRGPRR